MVGLLVAAVVIMAGVLGMGYFLNSSSSNSSEEITPGEVPIDRPILNDPVQANETIDKIESAINATVEERQQQVEDIERQLLGE